MQEYTAVACATKGGLLHALQTPDPDGPLLVGAGEILATLTSERPGPWMVDYDDGAEVAALWVKTQAGAAPADIRSFLSLRTLRGFARDDERDWPNLESLGWTPEMRWALADAAEKSIRDPRWKALVERDLDAGDPAASGRAAQAAPEFGIDVWSHHFARQREGRGEQWHFLMETEDPSRAAEVVALFEERIDVATLSSGPALELGFGPDFADASALGHVVRDLKRFPGLGSQLLLIALRSPVIPNRNMALNALEAWPRETWPAEAGRAIETAAAIEPDPDVRGRMEALRDG